MKLETLIPHVALTAPAAPDPLIVEALRLALDDMALRTGFWIEEGEIDVESGEARYSVPVPGGLVLRRVEEVRLNGYRLTPENAPDWMRGTDDWPAASGIPSAYTFVEPTVLVLDCLPTVDDTPWLLTLRMSVRPGAGTVSVPDWIVNDQRDVLLAGAKKFLAAMPDRPWTNEKVEARETISYERGMTRLAWRAASGYASEGLAGRARFL